MLEEKLQPGPAVCVYPSETTARGEGWWHPGLPQPLWEALEVPQLVLRLERGRDFYESCFLTKKKGREKKKNNPCKAPYKSGQ